MAVIDTWFQFVTMLLFNLCLAIVLLVVFCLLHGTEWFRRLFASRMYMEEPGAPVKPMHGPFQWLKPVWQATEQDIIDMSGLDAAVYLRMFTVSIQLFLCLSCLCLPVLLPLNATGGGLQTEGANSQQNKFTTSNIAQGSPMLWGHFVILYLVSFITLSLISRAYQDVWRLRHQFLATRSQGMQPQEYTLLLTDVPEVDRGEHRESTTELFGSMHMRTLSVSKSTLRRVYGFIRHVTAGAFKLPSHAESLGVIEKKADMVEGYLKRLFPGEYIGMQNVFRLKQVKRAYKRWEAATRNLRRSEFRQEKLRQKQEGSAKPVPETRSKVQLNTGFMGLWGPKVDAIPYWREQAEKREQELIRQQELTASIRPSSSAFIVFKSRRVSSVAGRTNLSVKGSEWSVQAAPQPSDVIWSNVELKSGEKSLRSHIGTLLWVVLVVFLYIPVGFVATLTSLPNLVKYIPFLSGPVQNEWFKGFLSSLLPGLGLRIILWCVPPLLSLLSRLEGCVSKSQVEFQAATRFFYILLFNVFLGYTFTGTLFSQLQIILDHPQKLVEILGKSIPAQSSFFITYTVISGVLFFLELLRIPIPILVYIFRLLTLGKDLADEEKRWNQGGINYHIFMPYQNLVICFGVVFAVIAPIILPFCLLYSVIGYFVWKHQIMYVYSYPYQTGGLLWPSFVDHVMVALLVAQLTAIGEFGLKEAFYEVGWAVPLPFITIYCLMGMRRRYRATFNDLPFDLATDVDEYNERVGFSASFPDFAAAYKPDCLRDPHTHHSTSAANEMLPRHHRVGPPGDVEAPTSDTPSSSHMTGNGHGNGDEKGYEKGYEIGLEKVSPSVPFVRGARSASVGAQPTDRWQAGDIRESRGGGGHLLSEGEVGLRHLLSSPMGVLSP